MDAHVVLAGLVGLVVGCFGVLGCLAWVTARRPQAPVLPPADVEPDGLPAGVGDLLSAIGGTAMVLDGADAVVRATEAAVGSGLFVGRELASSQLLATARDVRDDGMVRELELELAGRITAVASGARRGGRVLSVRVAPLGGAHVVLVATDHTQARRLEEVRRDFVVNVSHELKTPVGALSLLAEAMDDAAEDPVAVRRFAGRMQVEGRRLALLVHDVVELSRLQDGVPLASHSVVRLDAVVDEAVDRCRMTADARRITLDVGDPSRACVLGDEELLTTAVRNLVDNAIRYSEAGTRVGVGVGVRDGRVEVTVTDQGIGISAPDRERVFERFYRVDPARSRATGGTGLGLSIVKHVAVGHGGDVQLWSQVGQGSTFTLRLPPAVDLRGGSDDEGGQVASGVLAGKGEQR